MVAAATEQIRRTMSDSRFLHKLGPVRGRDQALLLLFCLALFLPGFFTLPPIDRDEPRFAQASRQLLESGDWVDIRFQAAPRYKKPIAIYWLQATAAALSD